MTEEAQARYEHMWEDLLRVGTAMSMRLCKNPWMAKLISVKSHPHVWDEEEWATDPDVTSPARHLQSSSSDGYSTPMHSPIKVPGNNTRLKAGLDSPCSVLVSELEELGSPRSVTSEQTIPGAGEWHRLLDPQTLDEVLSRMSLQSLACLRCVSHGFQEVAHAKLLNGGSLEHSKGSSTHLLDAFEHLGATYEPSMLRLPLRVAELPRIQKWDKYSIYAHLVSGLYANLAREFPEALHYQPVL